MRPATEPIHILSLGAGVQSSTLALMAAAGEVTPMPVCSIFADTQAEPKSVYAWLDWLEKQLPFPVHRVTKGNLKADALVVKQRKDGNGNWSKTLIPAFVKNPDGSRGITQRQCTHDYKVLPLIRKTLEIAGASPAVQWIGISLDEARRMRYSQNVRITHRWPLVEKEMSRHDCLRWMESAGFPEPPRSACDCCPYHTDSEWRRLRDKEPDAFTAAVAFDHAYRAARARCERAGGIPFLHDSLIPLDEVDFSTDIERGQGVLGFTTECEGMCGV